MLLLSTHDAPEWLAGTMSGMALSYATYASSVTGYPALVPIAAGVHAPVQRQGETLISSAYATPNGGGLWTVRNTLLTTDQAADYLTISPTAATIYVDVVTTDALYPDMQDANGFAWTAYSDGDTAQTAAAGNLYANQLRDGTVMRVQVDGVQVAQVDTGVAGLLSTRITLDGLSAHTVRITNSGTTTVAGADVARFMLLGVVTTDGGTGGVLPSWTSPVYDGGDPSALWVGADWEQAAPGTVSSLTFACGNTPTPDGSWSTTTIPIVETLPGPQGPLPFTQEGVPHGRGGFAQLGGQIVRARYAQVSLSLVSALPAPAPNGSSVPWVRSLEVYVSIPEQDTFTLPRLPPALRGPTIILTQSAYGAVLCRLHADAAELIASYSIAGARGRWLQQLGADFALPMAPGEGQAAYAARLQADLAGMASGPSADWVATQTSLYCGGTCTITSYGSAAAPWTYTLVIPAVWANPVSRAQIAAFVQHINPAGHIVTVTFL